MTFASMKYYISKTWGNLKYLSLSEKLNYTDNNKIGSKGAKILIKGDLPTLEEL